MSGTVVVTPDDWFEFVPNVWYPIFNKHSTPDFLRGQGFSYRGEFILYDTHTKKLTVSTSKIQNMIRGLKDETSSD